MRLDKNTGIKHSSTLMRCDAMQHNAMQNGLLSLYEASLHLTSFLAMYHSSATDVRDSGMVQYYDSQLQRAVINTVKPDDVKRGWAVLFEAIRSSLATTSLLNECIMSTIWLDKYDVLGNICPNWYYDHVARNCNCKLANPRDKIKIFQWHFGAVVPASWHHAFFPSIEQGKLQAGQ